MILIIYLLNKISTIIVEIIFETFFVIKMIFIYNPQIKKI